MSNVLVTTAEFRFVEPMQIPVKVYIKIARVTNNTTGIFEYLMARISKTQSDIVTKSPLMFYCKFEWPKRPNKQGKYIELPISYLKKIQKQARITVIDTLKELGHTEFEYAIYTQIDRTNYGTFGTLR